MPRKPYQIDDSVSSSLLLECEREFGFGINHQKRYEGFAEAINKRCGEYISPKTLSRAFSKSKSYSCSKQTLDILATYCGYRDIETYSKLYAKEEVIITKEEFKILKEIYNSNNYTEPLKYRDPVLFSISKIIVSKLRESTEDYLDLVNEYSDNPIAQSYFIEQSIDYDNLAVHYHKAIKTYLNHKGDAEAQIFGNSILYLNAFLTENYQQCKHYYKKVVPIKLSPKTHPFVIGRYYSTILLHKRFFTKEDIHPVILDLLNTEKGIKKEGREYMKFPAFHFTVCDSLLKCGEFTVAKLLLTNALEKYPDGHNDVDDGYYEAIYLFMAICNHALGYTSERNKYYKLCKANPFNFLSEKYYTIQLKMLELNLAHKKVNRSNIRRDLDVLIQKTKFSFFQTIIEKWTL